MSSLLLAQPNATTPIDTFYEGRNNALLGRAISAQPEQRSALLGQVATTDPNQALAFQGALTKQDNNDEDRRDKAIVNMARFYVSAPDSAKEQVRARLAPSLAKFGIDASSATPEQFDQTAKAIVSAWDPNQAEGAVVAPGAALINKVTGEKLYEAPQRPPAAIQSMEYLQDHPGLAQFQVDQRNAMRPQKSPSSGGSAGGGSSSKDWVIGYDADGNGVRINKVTGETVPLAVNGKPVRKPGPAGSRPAAGSPDRAPNNEQNNAAGFADRMTNAGQEISALEGEGYDPTNLRDRAATGVGGFVGNAAMTEQGQRYQQAEQNWVRANLRKESGAAIGKDEMEKEIGNYFPVAGDSPGVVQQKANNRAILERAMVRTAGPALPGGQGQAAAPSPASNVVRNNGAPANAPHNVGDVLTVNGRQYRVVGGDPNDPDLEPL